MIQPSSSRFGYAQSSTTCPPFQHMPYRVTSLTTAFRVFVMVLRIHRAGHGRTRKYDFPSPCSLFALLLRTNLVCCSSSFSFGQHDTTVWLLCTTGEACSSGLWVLQHDALNEVLYDAEARTERSSCTTSQAALPSKERRCGLTS